MTNGLTLRMYVEALLDSRVQRPLHSTPQPVLQIEVFISDFHVDRMQAAFEWILDLQPSLTHLVNMTMHSVPSSASTTLTPETREERRQHEAKGVHTLHQNRALIHTLPELYRFLLMGGHQGFRAYLLGGYERSTSAGY